MIRFSNLEKTTTGDYLWSDGVISVKINLYRGGYCGRIEDPRCRLIMQGRVKDTPEQALDATLCELIASSIGSPGCDYSRVTSKLSEIQPANRRRATDRQR